MKATERDDIDPFSDMFRPSSTPHDVIQLFGPSREYQSEEWFFSYLSVAEDERLYRQLTSCFLPRGYEQGFLLHGDASRKQGPIYTIRAWGVRFLTRYLDFCTDYVRVRNEKTKTVQRRAEWDARATSWDLPGHFIIASDEHAFDARGPSDRTYSFDSWCSYEDAIYVMRERTNDGKKRKKRDAE